MTNRRAPAAAKPIADTPHDVYRATATLRARGFTIIAPDEAPPRCKRNCARGMPICIPLLTTNNPPSATGGTEIRRS
jgi:hypothetical protein